MKKLMSVLLIAGSLSAWSQTVSFYPVKNLALTAGDTLTVGFYATKIAAGCKAQIILVDANTAEQEIVAIDLPLKNANNTLKYTFPFSWWRVGLYRYGIRLCGPDNTVRATFVGNNLVNVASAVWHPRAGDFFRPGDTIWVSWNVKSPIMAQTLSVFLVDSDQFYWQELTDGLYPGVGRVQVQIPADAPPGTYRISLVGFINMGFEEDESEAADSEEFTILAP